MRKDVLKRLILAVLVSVSCLWVGAACSRAEWDALFDGWDWRRQDRPVPPSRRENRTKSVAPQSLAGPTRPKTTRTPDSSSSDEPQTFYQVVLLSEPSTAVSPPDMKRIRLRRAQAESAARLLESLYVPVGVGGGGDNQYLVYQSVQVWKASAGMAGLLDVKSADSSEAVIPLEHADAFRKGVALSMRAYQPGPLDVQALKNAEACFKVVVESADAPPKLRWTAAILAGRLLTDLAFRFQQAGTYFESAEQNAPEKSLEKMTAMYHRADAYRQEGKEQLAVPLLEKILNDFPMYSGSHLYERCTKLRAK